MIPGTQLLDDQRRVNDDRHAADQALHLPANRGDHAKVRRGGAVGLEDRDLEREGVAVPNGTSTPTSWLIAVMRPDLPGLPPARRRAGRSPQLRPRRKLVALLLDGIQDRPHELLLGQPELILEHGERRSRPLWKWS